MLSDQTLHASKYQQEDASSLKASLDRYHGLCLKILDVQKGGPTDDIGHVEFVAYFKDKPTNTIGQLHECSAFVKEKGIWYYMEGQIKDPVKTRRNDPCWCSSGKKYKKCHGD